MILPIYSFHMKMNISLNYKKKRCRIIYFLYIFCIKNLNSSRNWNYTKKWCKFSEKLWNGWIIWKFVSLTPLQYLYLLQLVLCVFISIHMVVTKFETKNTVLVKNTTITSFSTAVGNSVFFSYSFFRELPLIVWWFLVILSLSCYICPLKFVFLIVSSTSLDWWFSSVRMSCNSLRFFVKRRMSSSTCKSLCYCSLM